MPAARLLSTLVVSMGTLGCGGSSPSMVHDALDDADTRQADALPDALPDVLSLQPGIDIAPGLFFTCARATGGTVKCWGYGANGTLGNGGTSDSATPVQVSNLTGALAIAAGNYDAFVVLAGGLAEGWGNDYQGELGDQAQMPQSDVPFPIPGVAKIVRLSAGETPCALLANTTVSCWGKTPTSVHAPPTIVTGLYGAASISPRSVGYDCVVMNDGSVRCWGMDYAGQLGDGRSGTDVKSDTPVPVMGLGPAMAVALGSATSCSLLADKTVWCWGSNDKGALGAGSSATLSLNPVQATGLSAVVNISLANSTGCATLANGTIKCWGDNSFGELGNGTTADSNVPVLVSGITSAVGVAVGDDHVCAQLSNGSFMCWGGNSYGGLGSATTTQCPQGPCSTVPIAVSP